MSRSYTGLIQVEEVRAFEWYRPRIIVNLPSICLSIGAICTAFSDQTKSGRERKKGLGLAARLLLRYPYNYYCIPVQPFNSSSLSLPTTCLRQGVLLRFAHNDAKQPGNVFYLDQGLVVLLVAEQGRPVQASASNLNQ